MRYDREQLDDRVERYLDGALPDNEAANLERELLEPEAARALSEALALRELLRDAGPEEPPANLAGDILAAVEEEAGPWRRIDDATRRERWERARTVFKAAAAATAATAVGFAGLASGAPALANAARMGGAALLGGLGAARRVAGRPTEDPNRQEKKEPSLWRRLFTRGEDR